MIDRREILDMATQMSLNPHVVEKDYVLGWMLAGISNHPDLRDNWVFKGGTCLKKCYFETYRFSEDLDFTLKDASHLDKAFLERAFAEIRAWIYEQTGIEVPADKQAFDIYTNPRGSISCQGKIAYRAPVSPRDMPRIKLDLTADECLVLPPVRVPVYHPYSDIPADGIDVLAYAYEEVFGEKVRALGERTRPRDLYDVINLFRNEDARPAPAAVFDVLRQKCDFKGIAVPSLARLEPFRQELMGLWESMLAHQLPILPPYQTFWEALPPFFDWLLGSAVPAKPVAYALGLGETVLRERQLRLPVSGGIQSAIEIIRFAAANRLLVELQYQGSTRHIEPYSLRRTQDGNIVLHAVRADNGEHRAYRLDRIQGARATDQAFTPRYIMELTPTGPMTIPQATRAASSRSSAPSIAMPQPRASRPTASKTRMIDRPAYVYQCPMCQKTFRRNSMNGKLNAHKNQWSQSCSGRTGFLVRTQY